MSSCMVATKPYSGYWLHQSCEPQEPKLGKWYWFLPSLRSLIPMNHHSALKMHILISRHASTSNIANWVFWGYHTKSCNPKQILLLCKIRRLATQEALLPWNKCKRSWNFMLSVSNFHSITHELWVLPQWHWQLLLIEIFMLPPWICC